MLCIKVLAALGLAAALQPPKGSPARRTNLSSSSAPDAVAILEERIVGEGSYGVVVAAIDENNKQYVAKRARKDDRSKRYFEVERTINEKLRGTPGLAPYRGVVEGPTPEKQFFDPPTTKYLLFDRVKGGRDAETYLNDGSCGVDGLAAALVSLPAGWLLWVRVRSGCVSVGRTTASTSSAAPLVDVVLPMRCMETAFITHMLCLDSHECKPFCRGNRQHQWHAAHHFYAVATRGLA